MFYVASLLETDVEEDHRDVGQMTSNNGQEYLSLQIVFNIWYKRQERMEILDVRVGDLQSSGNNKFLKIIIIVSLTVLFAVSSQEWFISCAIAELQEAFMLFDYSKSGRISARDIGAVIRSVGLKPSQAEIRSIMADVQQSGVFQNCNKFSI